MTKKFKIFANLNYIGCRDGQCGHFGVYGSRSKNCLIMIFWSPKQGRFSPENPLFTAIWWLFEPIWGKIWLVYVVCDRNVSKQAIWGYIVTISYVYVARNDRFCVIFYWFWWILGPFLICFLIVELIKMITDQCN